MSMRAGLLAGLLVVALESAVVAQSPSPDPPPWFGGRVEMPEHGFAVTLPDDWVAFDLSVDAASQLEAASAIIDTCVWGLGEAARTQGLAAVAARGVRLWSAHATSRTTCLWTAHPVSATPADETAVLIDEEYADPPAARDVEPPQRVDLPAGPAYHVRMSLRLGPVDEPSPSSVYVLDSEFPLHTRGSGSPVARRGPGGHSQGPACHSLPLRAILSRASIASLE